MYIDAMFQRGSSFQDSLLEGRIFKAGLELTMLAPNFRLQRKFRTLVYRGIVGARG
jgi:hypothetical protein